MDTETTYYSTTVRPKRVAFLVDPDTLTPELAAQVFAECSTLWGGRFHPVIPTNGRCLDPGWDQLIKCIDPDCIVSLASLDEGLVEWIHRELAPAELIVQKEHDRLQHRHLDGLEIDEIPFHLRTRFRGMGPLEFLHLRGSPTASGLFGVLNFGAVPPIISKDKVYADLDAVRADLESSSPREILEILLEEERWLCLTPHDVSCFDVNSPVRFRGVDADEFQVVIGSQPGEILYAWNWGLITTSSISCGLQGEIEFRPPRVLWLPADSHANPELLRRVGAFIHKRLSNAQSGKLRLVSSNLETDQLGLVGAKIKAGFPNWSSIQVRAPLKLAGDAFPCPLMEDVGERRTRGLERLALVHGTGLIDVPPPVCARDHADRNSYMVDLDLSCPQEPNDVYHPTRMWVHPRRSLVAKQFIEGKRSRVISDGRLSYELRGTDSRVIIRVPDSRLLLSSLLKYKAKFEPTGMLKPVRTWLTTIRPSAEGQRLATITRLFGGLGQLARVLEDPFWWKMFGSMSGADYRGEHASEHRTDRATQAIHEALNAGTRIAPDDRVAVRSLAERVAHRLEPGEMRLIRPSLRELKDRFQKLRGLAVSQDAAHPYWSVRGSFDEWDENSVEEMIEQGVLAQGTEIRCDRCKTLNWYLVGQVSMSLSCSGCQRKFPISLDSIHWQFQLNEVVARAIRDRGTMAALRTLNVLFRRSRRCFLYSPCLDIHRSENVDRLTDLDLVLLLDGRFMIGEAKASVQGFGDSDIEALRVVAKEVVPDEVLLAAPEAPKEAWERVRQLARGLRDELREEGVAVSLLRVIDWNHGELEKVK